MTKQRNKRKKEKNSPSENSRTLKTQRQTMDQNGGSSVNNVQCGQNSQNMSYHQAGQSFTQPNNVQGHSPMYGSGNNGTNVPYLMMLNSASPVLPGAYPQHNSMPATPGATNQHHDMLSIIMQRLDSMDSKLSQLDSIQSSIKSFSSRIDKFEQKLKGFETKMTKMTEIQTSQQFHYNSMDDILKTQRNGFVLDKNENT